MGCSGYPPSSTASLLFPPVSCCPTSHHCRAPLLTFSCTHPPHTRAVGCLASIPYAYDSPPTHPPTHRRTATPGPPMRLTGGSSSTRPTRKPQTTQASGTSTAAGAGADVKSHLTLHLSGTANGVAPAPVPVAPCSPASSSCTCTAFRVYLPGECCLCLCV